MKAKSQQLAKAHAKLSVLPGQDVQGCIVLKNLANRAQAPNSQESFEARQ